MKISTLTDNELREAHNRIMDHIWRMISGYKFVTTAEKARRKAVEDELKNRGMSTDWNQD